MGVPVLTKKTCASATKYDMVGLKFGPYQFLLYYQDAFKIAAGVLQSAKLAAGYEGIHPSKWSEFVDATQQDPLEPLNPEYRRSRHRPNFTTWQVAFERNLVILTFDQQKVYMHYSDAFAIYGLIRLAAKNSKRWAGDTSRQWTTRAHLVDAEENDKIVYA